MTKKGLANEHYDNNNGDDEPDLISFNQQQQLQFDVQALELNVKQNSTTTSRQNS